MTRGGFLSGHPIPVKKIPVISGFSVFRTRDFLEVSGFFDLAENKKSRYRIPRIGIWDPEKIPSQSQLCTMTVSQCADKVVL